MVEPTSVATIMNAPAFGNRLSPPEPWPSPATEPIDHDRLPDGIFVVGCPRSGTTLLQSLLAAHPLITSFSESNFFPANFARVPKTSIYYLRTRPDKQVRNFLEQNDEVPEPYDDLLRALNAVSLCSLWSARTATQIFFSLLERWTVRRGCRIWLEKSPVHLWFSPLIVEAAARSQISVRIVHILRDGRDVVASLYKSSGQWKSGGYTLGSCVKRWNCDLAATIKAVEDGGRDLVVFYEDLTNQPERTMKRLLSALSVPWDPHVIVNRERAARRLPQSAAPHHRNLLLPIRRSTTFEATFTPAERAWVGRKLAVRAWEDFCERCSID